MPTIINAIKNRSSKRAYLPKPVPRDIQEKILDAAAMTPSGANMQPWITYAISNQEVLKNIGDAIIEKMNSGVENDQFIQYYPLNWKAPYKKRRIETGIGLYSLMEVDRKDVEKRTQMWHDNFRWFGAQTVFFVFTDKAMIENAHGALIDCGAYMQSIMLAAGEFGLGTCPQGSTTEFGKVVAKVLDAPENLALLYSIVIGYEDKDAKINEYRPSRADLNENVTFIS
ncbi:MAG: nitroreductase [Sulfurimonas sp. RIFCSPLOWO2_12_FULL_36_74]|uniref:nitroreductase n=1 Tax=Sulfurimonas sp. RIFCSPLOWO2_12_36_12 TaxID=1802253 RepID=UPI0008AFB91D|nr:nitroreductase [Sulfurimonas sp. RIFCSPLOWO2_12_36_12]OHE01159.1 MAG: nitroreductase [Sulfurimonas sp. RIFCSPLOWO2_12_36_12]OHE08147.1 MAG: nitroreductase [Sulfurimonas sp. RIFCSPLOWO2_12_FULL_36_74]